MKLTEKGNLKISPEEMLMTMSDISSKAICNGRPFISYMAGIAIYGDFIIAMMKELFGDELTEAAIDSIKKENLKNE